MIGIGECSATYQPGHDEKYEVDLLVRLVIIRFMGLVVRDHLCTFLDTFGACPGLLLLLQFRYKLGISELCS